MQDRGALIQKVEFRRAVSKVAGRNLRARREGEEIREAVQALDMVRL
jgi:hypothetical protein